MTRATTKGKAQNVNREKKNLQASFANARKKRGSEKVVLWKKKKKRGYENIVLRKPDEAVKPPSLTSNVTLFSLWMLPIVTQIHRTKRKATAFVALIPIVVECLLVISRLPAFRHRRCDGHRFTIVSQNTVVKFQSPIHLRCVFHPSPFILVASRGKVISFVLVRCASVIAVCCMKTALSYSL